MGYVAIEWFHFYSEKIRADYSVSSLISRRPVVDFKPEVNYCSDCHVYLKVHKVRTRKNPVATMALGEFIARETTLQCPKCKTVYHSDKLRNLFPDRCTFSYDVMIYVGESLFLRHRQDTAIVEDLKSKRITISDREVAYLGKKYIAYLAIAHWEARDRIRSSMTKRGGFILHIDGTCDGDSPNLFSGIDGLSEIILGNVKIPTEHSDHIVPFLEELKRDYGIPLALVHDLGKGILKAVEEVFPGVPDYVCHFHFLRRVGIALLDKDYGMIRNCLKNSKVRPQLRRMKKSLEDKIGEIDGSIDNLTHGLDEGKLPAKFLDSMPTVVAWSLIHWILDADKQADGYGFPFDRHHFIFAERLLKARRLVETVKDHDMTEQVLIQKIRANKPLFRLYDLLGEMLHNRHLRSAVTSFGQKVEVFDKLREALRIAPCGGNAGLNDDGGDCDIKTIEANVRAFRLWLDSEAFPYDRSDYNKLADQIDKYWDKLFADPIAVRTPEGIEIVQPQRTNNLMERSFRGLNSDHCKKTGTRKMSRRLQSMLADTPLVKNLRNEEYMKILLNGKENLAKRFAEIDAKLVQQKLKEHAEEKRRMPVKLKKLIRRENFLGEITRLFGANAL